MTYEEKIKFKGGHPFWWIEIEGMKHKFSSKPLDRDYYPLMVGPPSEISERYNFLEGKTECGQLIVRLLDRFDTVTAIFATGREPISALNENVDFTETIIDVTNTSGIKVGDVLYVNRETWVVTGVTANQITVNRGQYDSFPAEHSKGDLIFKHIHFIRGRRIKLYESYEGLDWTVENACLWSGIIDDLTLESSTNVWTLQAKSATVLYRRLILEEPYKVLLLTSSVSRGYGGGEALSGPDSWDDPELSQAYKYAAVYFRDMNLENVGRSYNNLNKISYLRVGDELLEVEFQEENALAIRKRGDDWGINHPFQGKWETHESNIGAYFVFPVLKDLPDTQFKVDGVKTDHPIDIMLMILLSRKGDKTNSKYDVLPEGLGLGIQSELIDIGSFEKLRDDEFKNIRLPSMVIGWEDKPIDVEKFFAEEILRLLGCVLFTNKDGKLSITYKDPAIIGEELEHLDGKSVSAFSYQTSLKNSIQKITIRYDYNWTEDKFKNTRHIISGWNKKVYIYEDNKTTWEFKGLHTHWQGVFNLWFWKAVSHIWRFEKPRLVMELTCDYGKRRLMPGQNVYYSDDWTFDDYEGKRGLEKQSFVIEERSINFADGNVGLVIVRNPKGKFAYVAPSGKVKSYDGVNLVVELYPMEFHDEENDIKFFNEGDYIQFYNRKGVELSNNPVYIKDMDIPFNKVYLSTAPSPTAPGDGDIMCYLKYSYETSDSMKRHVALADEDGYLGPMDDQAYNYLG